MRNTVAIEARGIRKSFGSKVAIEQISLNVNRGDIHAILGPNGAGKTTFIKILATLLKPDEGAVKVLGHDLISQGSEVRKLISLTGQNASVDDELTGYENLYLFARLLGFSASAAKKRAVDLLVSFELDSSANKLVKSYSGGMRRRLDLAASIVKTPEILFLDEPTTGLDPKSRNNMWAIIRGLARQGSTVLLTTQYLEEADQLADRISVIDHGRVISEGTSDELKASVGANILHVYLQEIGGGEESFASANRDGMDAIQVDHLAKKMSFSVKDHREAVGILDDLQKRNLSITGFNLARPNLDEVFLALTGKPAEDETNAKADSTNGESIVEAEVDGVSIEQLIEGAAEPSDSSFFTNKLMFGWRNMLKIKHIPEQFMDVLITPIMFTFMFTYLFGGALAGSPQAYLQFFIPGILVQTVTFNAVYAGLNINGDISKGIFDRFRSMPIWLPSPLTGIFIGDFFRHLISGILVLLLGFILGFRTEAGILALVVSFALMIVFAMSISWVFIIMGLTMRSVSAVMSVGWLILMPVVFMSNIFADPATMPEWLQSFIAYNPLAWQVDAVRGLLAGNFSVKEILSAFGASAAISIVLAPIAIALYKRER